MFASGKKWCLAIVACAVMVIAAASWAQPEGKKDAPGPAPGKEAVPRRVQMFWANSDTNKDGVVDLKEYVAVQEKTFARRDLQGTVIGTSRKENTCLTDLASFHVLAAADAPQTVSLI